TTTSTTTRATTSSAATTGVGGSTTTSGAGGAGAGEPPPPEDEEPPPALQTPPIKFTLPDGAVLMTGDVCEATNAQAATIFLLNCAGCHGGRNDGERQGVPPFDFVLDPVKMMSARSATVPDPLAPPANQIPNTPNFEGMRFLIPGDP